MAQAKQQRNDPRRVDSLIGWLVLVGSAAFLIPILARNIEPYQQALTGLLPFYLSWILRMPLLGWGMGAVAFAAVQAAEIWPVLVAGGDAEFKSDDWAKQQRIRWMIAIIAYGIDSWMCSQYWPILKEGTSVGMVIAGFNLQMFDYQNLITTLITLFGCTGYIVLYRWVQKVA